ncbi:MAG: FecR family protein [Bacteroidetes bacterium]|nr:FecR family protein [Bacteroidota bacterium]
MKKLYNYKTLLIVISFYLISAYGFQSGKTSLGVFFKVINLVEKKAAETDWKRAAKGDALLSNDNIRTGESSVAVIKFTDKSMIRLQENSELIMLGEREQKATINDFQIIHGAVGFNITQQQNEQYTFKSPTSVASIRGTKGLFNHQVEVDMLIITEGIVNLNNIKSGEEQDIAGGKIAFSYPDGVMNVRDATNEELNSVDIALKAGDEQKENELKFELKDQEGNKSDLKIKYKE